DVDKSGKEKLNNVISVGTDALEYAKTICDAVKVIPLDTAEKITEEILQNKPSAVLWGSDDKSKAVAAQVAAKLKLGLCADCTRLEVEDGEMIMYRPALAGSIVAKIKSLTTPAMATVRTTEQDTCDILIAAGYGVKNDIDAVRRFSEEIGGQLVTTRKMVDNDIMPYEAQVGLTGKTVAPLVYVAIGVSGAVHHLAGMQKSGTVIAINPDKNASIFDYADFGILEEFH
ncbi:MAG: electron transfer flavoprotein subunit alpha/FixB family protein, partial [Clostridia bacterium]|nr:electron transfer flavoprotein subunit alpha/FixB family protein [Clostridia bacterium]